MRRTVVMGLVLSVVAALALAPAAAADEPTVYRVGAAKRSINPDADGTYAGKPVYLGGYGIGAGPLWEAFGSRPPASGILAPGIFARAFVVSTDDDPAHALALVSVETQGLFAAYQQGPYGTEDMRKGVEAYLGIPAERIIIGGNHTHAGPDTLGVWGGVPTEYLAWIKHQTIGAIADAWRARKAATLWFGTAAANDGLDDLISNQFGHDPANQSVESELRVLQARDATTGDPFATLLNLSAHPTVMGGDNTLVSADWPGPAAESLASIYGGESLVVMGALGRSQPSDGKSYDACSGDQYCAVEHYVGRVVARATAAVGAAQPLTGAPVVEGHSYLIEDPATNAILLALLLGGRAIGVPISRSILPPWEAGNLIGTVTFSARIGDLLFSGGPGELYPQIPLAVREATPGMKGHFVFGLAGDMLGYIMAPFPEAYPEPVRQSLFDGDPDDPTTWGISPIDNDNYFFNVSHTLGERVICSMLRGAGEVTGAGLGLWTARPQCAAFATDLGLPPGADTLAPATPG
ncbi:MAG: hypothetical protein HY775_09765 [Acidobacteria bacterium]|nr:hypothetical protein [Acidobacteriota bacterium]